MREVLHQKMFPAVPPTIIFGFRMPPLCLSRELSLCSAASHGVRVHSQTDHDGPMDPGGRHHPGRRKGDAKAVVPVKERDQGTVVLLWGCFKGGGGKFCDSHDVAQYLMISYYRIFLIFFPFPFKGNLMAYFLHNFDFFGIFSPRKKYVLDILC